MLLYGDAFWPTYTTGDNTGLIATDSMKNFIQRETLNFDGVRSRELSVTFSPRSSSATYPQVEGMQVSAEEVPYAGARRRRRSPLPVRSGRRRASSSTRTAWSRRASGIRGFRLLRLGGSAFKGFVRDEYTTLPEIDQSSPAHVARPRMAVHATRRGAQRRTRSRACAQLVRTTCSMRSSPAASSRSSTSLARACSTSIPTIAEVHLEANNRTWDTVAERGERSASTPTRGRRTAASA